MQFEGYIPKLCTVDQAERGLEIAWRRMEKFSEGSEGYRAAEKTVGGYIADLHFALFATSELKAELEAYYAPQTEQNGSVENVYSSHL